MAEFPALPLWTDAYIADTGDLNAAEHGAYLVMMMIAWRRPDCALPNDLPWLKRAMGGYCADMHGNRFNALVPAMLERFFNLGEDGKWRQKRLTKERDFLLKTSRKQSDNAKKRWSQSNENNCIANASAYAVAMPPHPHPIDTLSKEDRVSGKQGINGHGSKRGTRLPTDWHPSPEDCAFAEQCGIDAGPAAAEFRDYWCAVPGAKGCKLDWSATWRNRCRETAKRGRNGTHGPGRMENRQGSGGLIAAASSLLAEIEGKR